MPFPWRIYIMFFFNFACQKCSIGQAYVNPLAASFSVMHSSLDPSQVLPGDDMCPKTTCSGGPHTHIPCCLFFFCLPLSLYVICTPYNTHRELRVGHASSSVPRALTMDQLRSGRFGASRRLFRNLKGGRQLFFSRFRGFETARAGLHSIPNIWL